MAVRLISYDLNKETKRPPIVKRIKETWPAWARLSESSYAVSTADTPKQIFDKLSDLIDSNDNLYVITLARPYYGQGPKDVNAWLESDLPA